MKRILRSTYRLKNRGQKLGSGPLHCNRLSSPLSVAGAEPFPVGAAARVEGFRFNLVALYQVVASGTRAGRRCGVSPASR